MCMSTTFKVKSFWLRHPVEFKLDPEKAISYGRVYKEEVNLERKGHVISRRKVTSLHTPPTEK